MRNVLSEALVRQAADPEFVFLTGDLGYGALEPLQAALGKRFINAGVAEQNMVSVAAGLAHSGLKPWVYSIAPFVYARPFEQIRNDICLHRLPVRLIGNGGGYAYGVMGSTHHALEDYGALLGLPGMRVYVPAFRADVGVVIADLAEDDRPAYLRLGRCELPAEFPMPDYAPWRRLLDGDGPTLLAVGPLAGGLLAELSSLPQSVRPALWVLTELPVLPDEVPSDFLLDLSRSDHLVVVEEHVASGGVGQMLSRVLLERGEAPRQLTHRCAQGYVSGLYGSQTFHRRECGLDAPSIRALVEDLAAQNSQRPGLRLLRAA